MCVDSHRIFTTPFIKGRLCFGGYTTESEAYDKYVEEKECHIEFVADQFKDLIDSRAYDALINYKVN